MYISLATILGWTAGAVLTKMDGDSRGGAALSVKAVSGKPIKFVGTGEKLESLEVFYPDRIASRILGGLRCLCSAHSSSGNLKDFDPSDLCARLIECCA